MNKPFQIFLIILICYASKSAIADTLIGDQFYGVWSTASSSLSPKRQLLNISKNGGTWVWINGNGERTKLKISKDNISINNDLLTIYYKNNEKGFAAKFILEGWNVGGDKMIFGTVFMYEKENKESDTLQLFNGLPVTFKSGISQMPPQVFWSFFKHKGVKHTSASAIKSLEESLRRIDGIKITDGDKTKHYYLKRINSYITVTQKGNPAYPSAIGVRQSQRNPEIIEIAAEYAGNKNNFAKFYSKYNAELKQQTYEVKKYIKMMVKQKDASEKSK